jgi:hypothetical protein
MRALLELIIAPLESPQLQGAALPAMPGETVPSSMAPPEGEQFAQGAAVCMLQGVQSSMLAL